MIPFVDNDPRDRFLYENTVWTGRWPNGGTTANVSLIVAGDEAETDARPLYCSEKRVLQRSQIDSFYMTTPLYLGNLTHVRAFHDNNGENSSWFFSRMLVEDLHTGKKFYFIPNRWLSIEDDDGQVCILNKCFLTS